MKSFLPASAVAAGVALSALTATPAQAAPFANCSEANQAGVFDIQIGDARYTPAQDRDGDGVACESLQVADGTTVPDPQPLAPAAPAATDLWSWDNCSEAFANGVANIPAGTPGYGTHLDSDLDGIGCELNGDDSAGVVPANLVAGQADHTTQTEVAAGSQVEQIPVGGADTGVATQTSEGITPGLLGLGAASVIATVMGGLALRRTRAS